MEDLKKALVSMSTTAGDDPAKTELFKKYGYIQVLKIFSLSQLVSSLLIHCGAHTQLNIYGVLDFRPLMMKREEIPNGEEEGVWTTR